MKARSLAIALLVSLAVAAPLAAKQLWEYDWLEVRTPHFAIASAQDRERTLALASELEDFRRLAETFTTIGRFEERIPTKIYLLPKSDHNLGFSGFAAGWFEPGMRANYAAMIPSGSFSDEVLKHEYLHFLIHNRDRVTYPMWFDEGFADLFATMRVRGTTYEYGRPMEPRIAWLENAPWLSYKTVLNTRDLSELGRERVAQFYAQAWLLVHYLVIGSPGFGPKNTDFLRRCERGEPPERAFETAFGIEVRSIAMKVQHYSIKWKYGTLGQPLPPVPTSSRPIPRAEIAAALGTLALHVKGVEAATSYYGAALAADPSYGPALTGVGDLKKFAGNFEEAKPYYEKAIAAEPTNENHELDYAEYFLELANKQEAAGKDRDVAKRQAALVEARRHFTRAYALNPNNPEVLAMNGATYLFDGEEAAKGVESLEAAYALLPSQPQIRLLLARGYIAAGETEKARRQLTTLLAWAHSESVDEIRKLLDSLGNETADASGSPAENGANPDAEGAH